MKGQHITQQRWAIVLSKHVLSMEPGGLWVMADNTSGWADLGNQARVIDTLDRNNTELDWLREMRRSDVAAQVNLQVQVGHERARVVMRNTATV